ncbi:MAG: MBL fold metallo-hydrolase [Candidatus Diapherotrites archaeon]|jgi:glyoxylase-like metal-dependent hydrolase (beta-lactamase superfamily II)|nr:MBL fold metallo-hydrolase [Candidatus Diapherotrites archaeon]MBT4596393.1 MBL fold metallo-hydrolase [Candidatus Diapherotrites archaeon]
MAEVKVLIEGYAREKEGYYEASSSAVLIKDSDKKIIVDPGCNEELLLSALKKEGLTPNDIDMIFLTHYHPDHIINIRLFPGKDILDGDIIYRGDKEFEFKGKIPGTEIELIETPGHAYEQVTPLIKTDHGIIAIAEDLWWWEDGKQKTDKEGLLSLEDPFVKDKDALRKSRELILAKADYIIPGHGKMFKVEK